MVAYAAANGLECPGCWSRPCECDELEREAREAEEEAEREDLRTSAASLDPRDLTKAPAAYLNPRWVRRMQRRVERFSQTLVVDWLPWAQLSPNHSIERNSHVSHP